MSIRARDHHVAVFATVALIAALIVGLAPRAEAASSTVVVTPLTPHGWQEYHLNDLTNGCTDTSTGSQSWVTGPGTPPAGTGSHQFDIGTNGDSYEKLRTHAYDGTLVANLTTLGYSTYVSQFVDGQAPFLILSIDTSGDGVADTGLFFEPVYQTGTYSGDSVPDQGNVTLNTWQQWDALAGGYWEDTGGPPLVTLAHFAADHPGATIAASSSGAGGVALAAGCGAGAWDNFVGNVDAFTVGVNGNDTLYDFDPPQIAPGSPVVIDDDGQASPTNCNASSFAFTSVQAGVDFASPGDTITICPGTYTEQVNVQKNVTLAGTDQNGVVIKAPGSLVDSACVANGLKVIVDVCGGASVGMNNLTVSGPGPSGCGSIHYGVLVTGSATIDAHDMTIQDIRDEPLSGCQNGVGLRIGSGPLGQVGHGSVSHVTIKRYQKGGIVVDGPGTTATIGNNVIAGVGPTTAIAANGIQVSRSAVASVVLNTVSANQCDSTNCGPTADSSAGVLLFDAGTATTVSLNNVFANDIGIYALAADGDTGTFAISTNFVLANRFDGIFLDQGHANLNANIIKGPSNVGLEVYSFAGNTQASSATVTLGTFQGNTIDAEFQQDPGTPGISVTAHRVRFITGTGQGVVNRTSTLVDFTNNYWRTADGPSNWSTGTGVAVSDNVDFFPWYTNNGLTTLAQCTANGPLATGTAGNDILCGTSGPDVMSGLGGNDLILGNAGADTLSGGNGNDAIIGHGGDDHINGGAGADSIQGRAGTDTCNPGVGDRTSTCEDASSIAAQHPAVSARPNTLGKL